MSPNWAGIYYYSSTGTVDSAAWEAENKRACSTWPDAWLEQTVPVRWRSQPWRVARLIFCSLLVGVVVGVLVGTVLL